MEFGYSNPTDSINLAYHEFAHALYLDNLMKHFETYFKSKYRDWLMDFKQNSTFQEIEQQQIFREYAFTNEFEFFAISVKNFFNNPSYFMEQISELYGQMTLIFNQAPVNKKINP